MPAACGRATPCGVAVKLVLSALRCVVRIRIRGAGTITTLGMSRNGTLRRRHRRRRDRRQLVAYYLRERRVFGLDRACRTRPAIHLFGDDAVAAPRSASNSRSPKTSGCRRFTLGLFRRLKQEFGAGRRHRLPRERLSDPRRRGGPADPQANHAVQMAEGADIVLEDAAALKRRFAWISDEGIVAGALGLYRRRLVRRACAADAVPQGAEDEKRRFHHRRRSPASNATGNRRHARSCSTMATGWRPARSSTRPGRTPARSPPWPAWRCRSSRASATSSSSRRAKSFDDMPLLVDPSGVYVRPRRLGLHHRRRRSRRRPTGRPIPSDFEPDWSLFEEAIWPVLATRIPAFEAIKATRAWAGHYDYNTLDQNGVIGPHPEVRNFPVRQRLFRPRPAAGAGGRQGARRTDRAWRLPHHRLLGVRLRAHRRGPALPRAQRDLSAMISKFA